MTKIPFKVSARTAKLIGQENFSNPEGATIELVKNCYDADADFALVLINPTKRTIIIYDNKTFKFFVLRPSTGFLINLLKFEKKIRVLVNNRSHEKILSCLNLIDLIGIAKYKFPEIILERAAMTCPVFLSLNTEIEKDISFIWR